MARLPSTILSECSKKAVAYTLDLMTAPTYNSVGFAQITQSCILPYQEVVMEFYKAGYGSRKAEKWINDWADMGFVKWRFDSKEKYMAFLRAPISDDQDKTFSEYLQKELQKKKENAVNLGIY